MTLQALTLASVGVLIVACAPHHISRYFNCVTFVVPECPAVPLASWNMKYDAHIQLQNVHHHHPPTPPRDLPNNFEKSRSATRFRLNLTMEVYTKACWVYLISSELVGYKAQAVKGLTVKYTSPKKYSSLWSQRLSETM